MNLDFNGKSCTSDSKHIQRMTDESNGIEKGNVKLIGLNYHNHGQEKLK